MKLIIEDDEGRRTIVPFLGEALNIGRADDNQVRLGEKNVSRKHGRILRKSGLFVVEDLSSFTGIRVNGEKVKGKRQIKEGDLIQISEFDLQLQAGPDDLPKSEAPTSAPLLADDDYGDEKTSPAVTPEELAARRNEDTAVIKLGDLSPELKTVETIEIAEAERPRLVGANGTQRGVEFPLARSPVSIGRALENDVCLEHPQVSRSHCRLALVGGGWKVIDAESRHGVKVNGEPYAASPLHHGDLLEVGPVRLLFAQPGKPISLPPEAVAPLPPAPVAAPPIASAAEPEELPPAVKSSSTPKVALVAGAVVIALAAAVLLFGRERTSRRETPDAADAALQRAGTSAAAHRYREAVRAVQQAQAAGAQAEQTRVLPSLETEARAEEQYELLMQAISRGDYDAARGLVEQLSAVPTWFGGRALEHAQEVKAGYVKLHVERANAEHGRDDAACLSEANLALGVNPQSDAARELASACSAVGAPASAGGAAKSHPAIARAEAAELPDSRMHAAPAPAPSAAPAAHARAVAAADNPSGDAVARQLLHQGNLEATTGDYRAAIGDFERALMLNPSSAVLGGIYRSLGATHSRAGNADEGAHYYRLYLPYCDNPTEKTFLQKTLDDYDASRGRKN